MELHKTKTLKSTLAFKIEDAEAKLNEPFSNFQKTTTNTQNIVFCSLSQQAT